MHAVFPISYPNTFRGPDCSYLSLALYTELWDLSKCCKDNALLQNLLKKLRRQNIFIRRFKILFLNLWDALKSFEWHQGPFCARPSGPRMPDQRSQLQLPDWSVHFLNPLSPLCLLSSHSCHHPFFGFKVIARQSYASTPPPFPAHLHR